MSKKLKKVVDVDAVLIERGGRYGVFAEHARISDNIQRAMMDSPNWAALPADMKESLRMVAHKAARVLNGDPTYADSWVDMSGYPKLVADRLQGVSR